MNTDTVAGVGLALLVFLVLGVGLMLESPNFLVRMFSSGIVLVLLFASMIAMYFFLKDNV